MRVGKSILDSIHQRALEDFRSITSGGAIQTLRQRPWLEPGVREFKEEL